MRDGVGVGAAGRTHELEADAPGRPLHHGHAAGARAGSRGGERPRGHRQPRHRSPSHRRNRIRPQPLLLLLLLFTESHRSSMQNYAMQCNKIGLKRWLKLVGWIGMLIMVAPRAVLVLVLGSGISHGWMALHVFGFLSPLSLTNTPER